MRFNLFIRNRYFLIFVLLSNVVMVRLLRGSVDFDQLVASVLVAIPFTYWWVIPYLVGDDISMPSWGFSLKSGESKFTRLVLFVLGSFVYLACLFF